MTFFETMKSPIGNVHVEKNPGLGRPDVLIETEGKFLAIKINLSEFQNTDQSYDVTELMINYVENKKWIFDNVIYEYVNKFRKYAVMIHISEFHGDHQFPLILFLEGSFVNTMV